MRSRKNVRADEKPKQVQGEAAKDRADAEFKATDKLSAL